MKGKKWKNKKTCERFKKSSRHTTGGSDGNKEGGYWVRQSEHDPLALNISREQDNYYKNVI